jgi:hypothetical protein
MSGIVDESPKYDVERAVPSSKRENIYPEEQFLLMLAMCHYLKIPPPDAHPS